MSTFSNLLASIGIGNAELHLRLDDWIVARGGTLSGTLVVIGGRVAQHIASLAVTLHQVDANNNHVLCQEEVLRLSDLQIEPNTETVFPFTYDVPDTLAVLFTSTTWSAEADIRQAVNPRTAIDISIKPHPEINTLLEALRRDGFREIVSQQPQTDVRRACFYRAEATGGYELNFSNVVLDLDLRLNQFVGTLTFVRNIPRFRGRKLMDAWQQNYDVQVSFPRGSFLTEKGEPDFEATRAFLQPMIEAALPPPESEKDYLLRASSNPEEARETLLRPAGKGADTLPAQLLRPADNQSKKMDTP